MTLLPDTDDPLAGAALTTAEQAIWDHTRMALTEARQRIRDLERQILALERTNAEQAEAQPILTRPEFNREAARMMAFDERYGGQSSVVYFNIENMLLWQQTTHANKVEALIQALADSLVHQVRRSDIVGRLALDEFGVLLMRCDNAAAWTKAERLATALAAIVDTVCGTDTPLGICFGAYTLNPKEGDVASAVAQAASLTTRKGYQD